jgi:hypothetical protein
MLGVSHPWDNGQGSSTRPQRSPDRAAVSLEVRTSEALRAVRRLTRQNLPKQTLSRWIDEELVAPSNRRAGEPRARVAHIWSPEEVIGLAWLTKLRGQGIRISAYQRSIGALWPQLRSLLNRRQFLFFAIVDGQAAVMRLPEIDRALRVGIRETLCVWPLPGSVAQVRADILRERQLTSHKGD